MITKQPLSSAVAKENIFFQYNNPIALLKMKPYVTATIKNLPHKDWSNSLDNLLKYPNSASCANSSLCAFFGGS